MADGITFQSATPATPPAGTIAATDDAGAAGQVQIVKLAISTDGSATVIPADAANGLDVDVTRLPALAAGTNTIGKVRLVDADGDEITVVSGILQTSSASRTVVRKSVTPTISTSIYAAKDNVGGVMEFTNAAATSGGTIEVLNVQVVDNDQEMAPFDLVFFDRNPASGTFTDNAAMDPTDAELATVVGVLSIGSYADLNDNAVADIPYGRTMVLNGTSLYGALVARTTPTYTATSDLTVVLTIQQG